MLLVDPVQAEGTVRVCLQGKALCNLERLVQ